MSIESILSKLDTRDDLEYGEKEYLAAYVRMLSGVVSQMKGGCFARAWELESAFHKQFPPTQSNTTQQ